MKNPVRKPATGVRDRFDAATILFHWTTVALISLQFATGYAMGYVDAAASLNALLIIHRSTGASLFALTALRLLWRRSFAYLPPFPAHMPKLQQRAATANEYALYALLLIQPVTGLGDTIFRGKPFGVFSWIIPPLVPRSPETFELFHAVHELGAEALLGFIGLHALAALFHQFVLRDRVLQRMLFGRVPARARVARMAKTQQA